MLYIKNFSIVFTGNKKYQPDSTDSLTTPCSEVSVGPFLRGIPVLEHPSDYTLAPFYPSEKPDFQAKKHEKHIIIAIF